MPFTTELEKQDALENIGQHYLKSFEAGAMLVMPDPKLKDVRCHERALYYATLRQKYNSDPGSLSKREIQDIGSGVLLTLNVTHKVDGFGFVFNEFLFSGNSVSIPYPYTRQDIGGAKKLTKFLSYARERLSESASTLIKKEGSVEEKSFLNKKMEPFIFPDIGRLSLNPFYPAGIAIMQIAFQAHIPIAIQSVKLADKGEGRQQYLKEDLLCFMPAETKRFQLIDISRLAANMPVIVFKGLQVQKDHEFIDDLERLRKEEVSLSDILLPLHAVHGQVHHKIAEPSFCEEDFSTDRLREVKPASPLTFFFDAKVINPKPLYPRHYRAAADKGLEGVSCEQRAPTGSIRATGNISFIVEHVFEASAKQVKKFHATIHKTHAKELSTKFSTEAAVVLPDALSYITAYAESIGSASRTSSKIGGGGGCA